MEEPAAIRMAVSTASYFHQRRYNKKMQSNRNYSPADRVIIGLNDTLQTLFAKPAAARPYPASCEEAELSDRERRQSAGYMRVNHVGEVCAQALYQSQALTASSSATRDNMQRAAKEEIDHLAWCEQRLEELGAAKSLLNPLWYAGSFALGAAAGIAGEKWNLGFVAETERQVVDHLENHLSVLPESDMRSREVVKQMREDEAEHAKMAVNAGAATLPRCVRQAMRLASSVMTRTAYWI